MKRTFAAIDISEEAKLRVVMHIDQLRRTFSTIRVGWERPEKLHFTLKFFGDVEDALIPELQRAIGQAVTASKPFSAAIEGTGRFPPKGDPRVLWLGAKDGGKMCSIAEKVADAAFSLGFEPEKRRFEPHLTIARLKEPRRSRDLALTHISTDFEPVQINVASIVLYESSLLPSGSVYQKLCELPLGGA